MYEKYHVLFVDDEENILSSIRRGLIDEEYICHFATSGPKALEIMEEYEVAVIVSDMKMPGMDGLKLLNEVRRRWPRCVRIVLSGYTQLAQMILSINQADIFRFITKPWHLQEDLIDGIQKALNYYILTEENENYKQMLENKNQLYLKMLYTLETKTKQYKQCVDFLIALASASISLGENLDSVEAEVYQEILTARKELLSLFGNAAMANRETFQSGELENLLADFIAHQFEMDYVNRQDIKKAELTIYYEMMKAAIIATKIVLTSEVNGYGISARVGNSDDGTFCVFLLTMFDHSSPERSQLFQKKLQYLMEIHKNLSEFGLVYTIHNNESAVLVKIELLGDVWGVSQGNE